jgi:uncharacterized protein YbcI
MNGAIEEIYNPSVGRYDVTVAVGPSYTTRRQEAFDALIQLSQGNPRLMEVAGDLIMKAADFPMAEELAERLGKTLPPELKEQEGENPEVQAVKAQADGVIKEIQGLLQKAEQAMLEANEEAKELQLAATSKADEIALKQREIDIKEYEAVTKRMQMRVGAMSEMDQIDPGEIEAIKAALAQVINMVAPPEQIEETPEPAQAGFLMPE